MPAEHVEANHKQKRETARPLFLFWRGWTAVFESAERSLGPWGPQGTPSPLRYRKCPPDIYFTSS